MKIRATGLHVQQYIGSLMQISSLKSHVAVKQCIKAGRRG